MKTLFENAQIVYEAVREAYGDFDEPVPVIRIYPPQAGGGGAWLFECRLPTGEDVFASGLPCGPVHVSPSIISLIYAAFEAARSPAPAPAPVLSPTIGELVLEAHRTATAKGWWEAVDVERSFPEKIALMHSELSEALEAYRDGHGLKTYHEGGDKPEGVPSELADVRIRIFDLCGAAGIDLEAAILEKMAYNATRPWRHGGKVC